MSFFKKSYECNALPKDNAEITFASNPVVSTRKRTAKGILALPFSLFDFKKG